MTVHRSAAMLRTRLPDDIRDRRRRHPLRATRPRDRAAQRLYPLPLAGLSRPALIGECVESIRRRRKRRSRQPSEWNMNDARALLGLTRQRRRRPARAQPSASPRRAPLPGRRRRASALPSLFADRIVLGAPRCSRRQHVLFVGSLWRGLGWRTAPRDVGERRRCCRARRAGAGGTTAFADAAQGLAGLKPGADPGTVGRGADPEHRCLRRRTDEHIHAVEAFEPARGATVRFARADCCFAYATALSASRIAYRHRSRVALSARRVAADYPASRRAGRDWRGRPTPHWSPKRLRLRRAAARPALLAIRQLFKTDRARCEPKRARRASAHSGYPRRRSRPFAAQAQTPSMANTRVANCRRRG